MKKFSDSDVAENLRARYELGRQYLSGDGVAPDPEKAFGIFLQGHEAGCFDSTNGLGACYLYGQGTEQDLEKAANLFHDHNVAKAIFNLGNCHLSGWHFEPDPEKGFRLILEGYEKGYEDGITLLAYCYIYGLGTAVEPKKGIELLQKSAENGNKYATFQLGEYYATGVGVRPNPKLAIKFYEKAATLGFPGGEIAIGNCYIEGKGVRKNVYQAAKHYEAAAKSGEPSAVYALAWYRLTYLPASKEDETAIEMLKKAIALGSREAEYQLGLCYKNGRGVMKDDREAVQLFRNAAEAGVVNAQYDLGKCLQNGVGTFSDHDEADYWLNLVAENNFPWTPAHETAWRSATLSVYAVFWWWSLLGIGIVMLAEFVSRLVGILKGVEYEFADSVRLAQSAVFLPFGPLLQLLGSFVDISFARWACVWLSIGTVHATVIFAQSSPFTYQLVIIIILALIALAYCRQTIQRTVFLERKLNGREISLIPTFFCGFSLYAASWAIILLA